MKATIESLECTVWPEPEFRSALVMTAHALRKKPVAELTPNELRVAFSQDIGTAFLSTRVLEVLACDPAAGELFEGDLILAVMRSRRFREDEPFRMQIVELAAAALKTDLDLDTRREIENLKIA
jgi:hypothetical protein